MKSKIFIIILSLLINILVLSLVRGYIGMNAACVVAVFLYFWFTHKVFKSYSHENILLKLFFVFLGTFIVHVPFRIIDFKSQLVSFPEFLSEILGSILGYIYFISKGRFKLIPIVLVLGSSLWLYLKYDFIREVLNTSNMFYKNVNQINISAVPYFDSDSNQVNEVLFGTNRFVIINIWSTSCGACVAEFPLIDSLYQESLKQSSLNLYTACILQNQKNHVPFDFVKQKGRLFPVFTIPSWDYVIREYGMDGVPITFLIKNKKIIYRGSLKTTYDEFKSLNKLN